MTLARHPLVFPYNTREPNAFIALAAAKDNRMIGVMPQIVEDPIKGEKSVYAAKRLGLNAIATPSAGNYCGGVFSGAAVITGFASGANLQTPTIFYNTTNCGAVDSGHVMCDMTDCVRGGVIFYMIPCRAAGAAAAYFLASDSVSDSSFGGDTHTDTIIDNITGLTDTLYPGQPISGTGIQAGTRIATVTSATAITTTLATTGTATVTITKTHLAKIIDADFPALIVGPFADLDGYLFIMQGAGSDAHIGNVYQSDLNSVYSWPASGFIPCASKVGQPVGVWVSKNLICAGKARNIEFFRNAGNPLGSTLSRIDPPFTDFGMSTGNGATVPTTKVGDVLYFLGAGFAGGAPDAPLSLYSINGASISKIEIPGLASLYAETATNMKAVSYAGLKALLLSGVGETGGFLLFPDLGIMTETGFPFDAVGHRNRIASYTTTTGKTYTFDTFATSPTYQDDSANFDCVLQFDSGDKGSGNTKTVTHYDLDCDMASAGTAALYYSDDDGATWTQTDQSFDLTAHLKRITNVPSYTGRRMLRLVVTGANRAWRGRFIDENYSIGTA